ncbi:MAG: beta galactosidase jelly roll domain-containing protein, partial [Cyclobacteriaceae bacterium]
MHKSIFGLLLIQLGILAFSGNESEIRKSFSLNDGWQTIAGDSINDHYGFERQNYATLSWTSVNIPHNWDRYEGYRRLQHGNRHGYAWYRKNFEFDRLSAQKKYFIVFEGVGSYATIFLNGQYVGEHAGGRTSFTLDVTDFINLNGKNLLAVRVDHPAFIEDLPWVCGGCSSEYGFSEGSQPMGIFRPVHLIETNPVRVEPFGIHVWNDTTVNETSAFLNINTELKNYSKELSEVEVIHQVVDENGKIKTSVPSAFSLKPGELKTMELKTPEFSNVELWSPESPYLYSIVTSIYQEGLLVDRVDTPYGIRWIKWESTDSGNKRLLVNGDPLFINGTCEYEHNMGNSHAFSAEMVEARVS